MLIRRFDNWRPGSPASSEPPPEAQLANASGHWTLVWSCAGPRVDAVFTALSKPAMPLAGSRFWQRPASATAAAVGRQLGAMRAAAVAAASGGYPVDGTASQASIMHAASASRVSDHPCTPHMTAYSRQKRGLIDSLRVWTGLALGLRTAETSLLSAYEA